MNNIAEQEFKRTFPRLCQQEKLYEDKFGVAANKYIRMHQKFYPKHKDNPIIYAHPGAANNPKLIPLKKQMVKYGEIYTNYGELIAKNQREFVAKYGHEIYSNLWSKYKLNNYY